MASWPPVKNATFTLFGVLLDADGDPVTGATGLASQVSVDGGVFAAGAVPVEEGEGFYSIALTAANMNGDQILVALKASGPAGVKNSLYVIATSTRQIDNLTFPNISGRGVDVNLTGDVDAAVVSMAAGVIAAATFAAGAIDAAAIATDAIGAAELATDAVAEIVNAIWDELTAEARVVGSYGQLVKDDINATIASRAIPGDLMGLVAGAITAAKFAAGAIDAAAIATAAITAAKFAAGAIDAAAIATGAIDADAVALDAIGASEFAQGAADKVFGTGGAALTELAQAAPPATPRPDQAMMALYMALRNLMQVTATEKRVTNDLGTVIFKKALSDDGTTYAEAEAITGP